MFRARKYKIIISHELIAVAKNKYGIWFSMLISITGFSGLLTNLQNNNSNHLFQAG